MINFAMILDKISALMKFRKRPLIIALSIALLSISISLFIIIPIVKKIIQNNIRTGNYLTVDFSAPRLTKNLLKEYNPETQTEIDALHYELRIQLNSENEFIKGNVTIKFITNDINAREIDINFYDNLKILNVTLNNQKVDYKRYETIFKLFTKGKLKDTSEINILYEGKPKNLGFGSFSLSDINGSKYIYTINEPFFASTWFPCIDRPDDKALADIYITNDSSCVSLSNGKLVEVVTDNDKRTYHWKTFYPISTYLIAIYSGNYKSYTQKYISITGDTLQLYCFASPEKLNDAIRDFSDHSKYIETFEKLFGPYPFIKEKYAITEFFWNNGAMEHQTITGIGSRFITGKKFFQDMFIHELSHHWWGNAVGPKTWKDIWLNEGFATYSEALYWEYQAGISALQSTLESKSAKFIKGTLYNPNNNLFSSLVYNKGAWVLHMLRKEVGDSIFFKILRTYFETYKYKNASTGDFQNICEKVSKRNLNFFFNQWIYKGKEIIDAEYYWNWMPDGNGFKIIFYIKQLQNDYDIYKFPVDLKIIYQNGNYEIRNFYVKTRESKFEFFTEDKPLSIEVDPDKWLLAEFKLSK